MVRARWEPLPPIPAEVGGPWARPDDIVKGERLALETPQDVRARLAPFRRLAATLLVFGAGLMAFPLLSIWGMGQIAAIVGFAFVATGVLLLYIRARWKRPWELFERGLLAYPYSDYPPTFYAFTTVRSIEEKHGWMSGDYYLFRTSSLRMSMQLPRGTPFGELVAQQVRKVIGSGQADDLASRLARLQQERAADAHPPT
jgi:hypothetical protein